MIRPAIPVSALAAALALTACTAGGPPAAETAAAAPNQCFSLNRVEGFSRAGVDHVVVHVRMHDSYEFETDGTCRNLDFNQRLALVSRTGSSQVCGGWDVDLIVPASPGPAERCRVRMIRKLSPEEARASTRKG
jgi:hypothetical protein